MNYYLEMVIYFVVSYIISFIVYWLYVNKDKRSKGNKKGLFKRKKKVDKIDAMYEELQKNVSEVTYIVEKFHLSKSEEKIKKIKKILSFINPLIISITFIIIINVESFMLGIVIGFVIMMALVYAVYEIIGRILKKGEDKNV